MSRPRWSLHRLRQSLQPTRSRDPDRVAADRASPLVGRRRFLTGIGVGGAALAGLPGASVGKQADEPSISFPDGTALVLERTRGPMQAAVRTTDVHMPDGGWVVISLVPVTADGFDPTNDVIGRSFKRLPAGHFERLFVAVRPLASGDHHLYATLFKGDKSDQFPDDGPGPYGFVADDATITFP